MYIEKGDKPFEAKYKNFGNERKSEQFIPFGASLNHFYINADEKELFKFLLMYFVSETGARNIVLDEETF